jgi:phosphoribosylformylglycinamidine synthase|tara:strand:+ start:183 stop:422 length:240 start_codon:yes stop_codon:yes gene_type:complete
LKISVIVTLKKEVLDPQGKIINQTINNMGISSISNVRQGKYFDIEVNNNNLEESKKITKEICEKLLVNSVIENYKIISD